MPVVIQADPKLLVKGPQPNFLILDKQLKKKSQFKNDKIYSLNKSKVQNRFDCKRVSQMEFFEYCTQKE